MINPTKPNKLQKLEKVTPRNFSEFHKVEIGAITPAIIPINKLKK